MESGTEIACAHATGSICFASKHERVRTLNWIKRDPSNPCKEQKLSWYGLILLLKLLYFSMTEFSIGNLIVVILIYLNCYIIELYNWAIINMRASKLSSVSLQYYDPNCNICESKLEENCAMTNKLQLFYNNFVEGHNPLHPVISLKLLPAT